MGELKTAVQVALEKLEAREPIPKMTDPLSKYWNQPNRREIEVDDKYAMMSKETFDELCEYSLSVPSGVYDGKMWKANKTIQYPGGSWEGTDIWYLRWYGPDKDPDKCAIHSRRIIIV